MTVRAARAPSTPQTFLMAPRLNGSDTFSACSIAQMQPTVNNASCLSTYDPPDVSLEVTHARTASHGRHVVHHLLCRARHR